MENYQIVVSNLAAERGEKDPNLVLNLFQSLLDEFTRGHTKNDFELPKVSDATLGRGKGPAWHGGAAGGRGTPGTHTDLPSCSLTAEQSSEKEAEAGTRCEYECALASMYACECVQASVFSCPALRNPS